jgi:energy-coupling factor transporter transmembrane protein EcfT
MTPASIQLGSLWMVRSEYFKVLPREFTSKVIIHIGKLPVVGETALTYGNAYWTASFIIKIFISIMALYFFIYTTSVSDLSYSLQKLGIPSSIIFLISCSYRFIPLMLRRQQIVTWARSLRGWRIGKNPIKVIYNVGPIFFSLGLSAYNAVEQTTRAISLKGFDVKKKTTPIRDIKFTYIDYVLSLFFIAVFAISTYLNLVYNIGNI